MQFQGEEDWGSEFEGQKIDLDKKESLSQKDERRKGGM